MLGYLWSLLKPLFLFAILYIVFTYIIPLGKDVEHYPVYLLVGIVLWNFFTEATIQGTSSIVARGDLIRKVSIPRYLVVISSSLSALINLCLSFIVVIVFALINGIYPSPMWLLVMLVILELFIFALGLSFLLSALYVRFRDVNYIWEIILQAGFYATPIIYSFTRVPENLHGWFFINPMAQIIQDVRYIMVTHTPTVWTTLHSWTIVIPFLIITLTSLTGWWYFRSQSKYFAEDI